MSSPQTLGLIMFVILGFCGLLALGAFLGKTVPNKVVIFAGILALISVVFFSLFAAYYFITTLK